MNSRVNLNDLVRDITLQEGLEQRQSVAQVREIVGILGHRWRSMSDEEFQQEADCIRERAGLRSQHRD